MKLQDQVCAIEQARRIRELGVSSFGLFVFYTNKALPKDFGIKLKEETGSWAAFEKIKDGGVIKYYPAFTVAELGVMLPDLIVTDRQYEFVTIKEADDTWLVRYVAGNDMTNTGNITYVAAKTEAEARAAMLIHVLENKLATAEQINSQLNA